MQLQEIDTIQDLREWVKDNLPNAIVVDCDDEVVIQTGLVATMGGYLHEKEGECDSCSDSYELSSRDNRCGDCGNCGTCCTHEREGK